ncbi:MAG TPA: hypothetical protein PKM78_08935 [Anaerolineae bacterium]|nr:hypothetical protein [Anaerolineae bacterium]
MTEYPESMQELASSPTSRPPAAAPAADRADGLVDSLVRLGVGGVSLGARIARQPLALLGEFGGPRSDAAPPPTTSERAMDAAVGAAVETGELARRGVRTVTGINRRVWRMTEPARRPLDALGVTGLVQRPVQAVAERVEAQVDTLQAIGRNEVEASRQRVLGTLSGTIDGIIAYLTNNRQVDALIEAQIDRLLPLLAEHPAVEHLIEAQVDKILPKLAESAAIHDLIAAQVELLLPELAQSAAIHDLIAAQVELLLPELAQSAAIHDLIAAQVELLLPELAQSAAIHDLIAAQIGQILPELAVDEQIALLIRAQGDKYIDYLNEYPEKVRNLVSGQGVGLAGQLLDEVRERTVTADSVAEMVMRNLIKRKQRNELPPPPDNVQARAASRILPSDFVNQKGNSDDR